MNATVTVCVDVDTDEVLDQLTLSQIEDYVKKRFRTGMDLEILEKNDLKEVFQTICIGRCPRNMHEDNETIRHTINELMDEVLV